MQADKRTIAKAQLINNLKVANIGKEIEYQLNNNTERNDEIKRKIME